MVSIAEWWAMNTAARFKQHCRTEGWGTQDVNPQQGMTSNSTVTIGTILGGDLYPCKWSPAKAIYRGKDLYPPKSKHTKDDLGLELEGAKLQVC
jgi:hypothetical protein